MSNEQTTLNLDNVDLSGFNQLDQPMSAEDMMRGQTKNKLSATMSQAVQTVPQHQAKLNNLSRQSGIPVPAVESDIQSVENHLKLKNIDLESMVNDNPVTAGYLTDYNNASIAHNDIDNLKGIETVMNPSAPEVELPFNTLRGVAGRVSSLLGGMADFVAQMDEAVPTGMFTMVGGIPMYMTPAQVKVLEDAKGGSKLKGFGEALKEQDFDYIPASTWGSTKQSFSDDGVISGMGEALSFGIESTIVSSPDMLAAAFALPAYILSRSNEMGDARAKNKGMKEGTIKETMEAMPFAIGSSLLERILPATIFKGMSKTEVEKVGQEILEGATSKIKEVYTKATSGLILEAGTEAVQEGIIEYIGEKYGTDAPMLISEMLDRGLGGAVGGGIGGGILAGGAESINVNRTAIEETFNRFMTRKADARAKEQTRLQMLSIKEQKDIDGINDLATNSELRQLDPEAFRQFIEQSDGDKDLQVFIDGVQTRLYLNENQDSSDPVIQMLSEKANEAAALGTDLAIPIADFATVMAGTPHYEALREFMTMNGDTTAPFRQEEVTTASNDYVANLMNEAQESVSEYVEAQDIYASVREQLIDTGRVGAADASVMAQLVPAWATVFAKRNGLTIKQAYEQSGLVIEGPQTGEAARLAAEQEQLNQKETPAFRDAPTMFNALKNEFLDVLPEDSDIDEVMDSIDELPVKYHRLLRALEKAEWLGFEYPSQSISAAMSEESDSFDLSVGIKTALGKLVNDSFKDSFKLNQVTKDSQGFDTSTTFYHGTKADFTDLQASQSGEYGKGVYLSPRESGARYWANLTDRSGAADSVRALPVQVRTDKLFKVTKLDLQEMALEEDPNDDGEPIGMNEVHRRLKEQGYEGVNGTGLTEADNQIVIFDPKDLKQLDGDEQFKQSDDSPKNLVVTHNLSAENIIAAASLGGLAAPSIATVRSDISDFTAFGEVSLLADPSLLESDKARNFDADIYSPRQPRAVYDINNKAYYAFDALLDPDGLGLSKPDIQSVSDISGADNLRRSAAVQYHWLTLQGKAPKIKTKKIPPAIKKADKLGTTDILDVKFRKVAKEHYTSLVDAVRDQFPERAERLAGLYFMEDGEVNASSLRDFESQVRRFNREGNTDLHQLRGDIDKKLRTKKLRDEYDQWVTATFNDMVDSKKIFKGFTNSGNRKYLPYNMQNVVKEMTQKLQAGETSFYGAGSIRSAYANEMKTIERVKARRDSIVTEEQMTDVKEDSANVLEDALAKLKPFYKFDADSWGYSEDAGNAIIEGRKGLNEAFDMTPEAYKIVSDLTEYLAGLPSSYFETKIQRPVAFSEFNTAVVPKGMDKQALQILKDAGLKIKTYDDVNKTRQQVIAEQQKLLFQEQGVTKGYYSPSESAIRLTEASDLSTFLHEFAHFMYEMELTNKNSNLESVNTLESIHNWYKRNAEDVAKEAGEYAPNTTIIPRHVAAFLDTGTAGDKERDDAIRRAVHEQFARGFEKYLLEGTAPSIELRNAFRTFARWMTQIYRVVNSFFNPQNIKLDDEMRQVFDRLIATEEQINAAEARAQYAPMFTDAAMAGMTEQEFIDYKKRQEKVTDKQTETLRQKLIKQLTRQTKQWWKDELADETEVQTETLKNEKVYLAREALKNGDIKIDHAAVKELVGEDVVDKIGRSSRRIPVKLKGMTVKGALGVHPDEAAALLGYGSGDQLLKDLVDAVPIDTKAEAQAESVMLERHGDVMHDGTIEKLADEALLNEERGAMILQELKALSKGSSVPTIDRAQLKDMAETNIGKLAFRDIHPAKYRKAEIRAAQESAVALKEGNREAAARAKVRQAMNFYLNKAATEARNDTMKIVERMARYNKKTVKEAILRAENGYWEQIVKILGRFEFRKAASMKGVDLRNQDINSWVKERVENDGDALVLTAEVLDETYITHWKNVPYTKLKGVNDSVKNLEHVARYANKIKTMGEEIEFKKLVSRWVDHMQASTKTRFKSQRTDVAEGKNWGRWAMGQMTKIPFLASWLDNNERGGMSHEILVQPFTDAQFEEVKLWREVGQPVMDLIENRSKADIKRHNTRVFIPELVDENNDGNLYGNQILAVALNTGNAGNLRKMLLGENWANPDDDSEVNINNVKLQAVLKRMTKADWDLVQTIWDKMETLYPQLAEVHRRTTGLTPPKVDSTPVQTPFGEYNGGYYPVKYDPNRSQRAQENEDRMNAQVESMFSGGASIQASVSASATNERTQYYAPIRLSLDVVPSHFQESIHFITHHDAVRQANKLIRNPEVATTIKEKLGPEEYAQLRPWLNDIAKDGREAATKFWWEDMIGRLRFGITLGSMGFKASTGIMQFLGLSNIIAEVGGKYTYQAFREILGSTSDIQGAWNFASDNSKILSNRVNSMDREIKNAMSRINSQIGIKSGSKVKDIFYRFDNSNMLKTVQEASMKHIAYIQTFMVDLPTWYAAYLKEMDSSGDEAKAYRVADFTVESLQGSGSTKDLAAIMRTRNETTRMLTMFMTFFSALWNLNRDVVKGAASGAYSPTSVAAKLMFLITVPVALEMLMRGELGDGDEDEEFQKFLTKTALYPIASVPFVRDIASGVIGEFGYNMSPVASLVEQGTNAIPELIRRPFTDDEITKGQAKGGSKFIAAAAGIPATGQAWATGEHLYEVMANGEDFTTREFLFGPKREK
jgi:hypothetical protein